VWIGGERLPGIPHGGEAAVRYDPLGAASADSTESGC
jgi:hypothetical protein